MLNTFNCGIGMLAVVSKEDKEVVLSHIRSFFECQEIGTVIPETKKIRLMHHLHWD